MTDQMTWPSSTPAQPVSLRIASPQDGLERALEREQRRSAALRDIGLVLGSTLDLDELLTVVIERVSEVLDAERSTLYLIDFGRQELWSKVAQGTDTEEIRLQLGEGLAGWVAREGLPLRSNAVYSDPRFRPVWDMRMGFRTRSTLAVPVRNKHGALIGVLQVLNKLHGAFEKDDETLLESLAAQAAVAIENAKLFVSMVEKNVELLETKARLEHKVREQDLLFHLSQASTRAMSRSELLGAMLRSAVLDFPADAVGITWIDETGNKQTVAMRSQDARLEQGELRWLPQVSVLGHSTASDGITRCLSMRQSELASSVADAMDLDQAIVLCVPLQWPSGKAALELLRQGASVYLDDERKLAVRLAYQMAAALELAHTREQRARDERLSAVGRFMSTVLHDLKTPMAVIAGYAEMMAEETEPSERQRFGDTIRRQVEIVEHMTRETLAFVRGDRQVWIRKVYLQPFFATLAEELRRELEPRRVRLVVNLEYRGAAYLDINKIERAVYNLARNAAEALTDQADAWLRIAIRLAKDDPSQLEMRFMDNGPGIPDAVRHQIFESFATHGKEGGTGLGLAIVRKVVEDHGGTVQVESQPGRTEFCLRFPLKER